MSSPRSGGGGGGGGGSLVNAATATGDADDDSQTGPLGELVSVGTSFDAPTVSVIPAPEDLIFYADVGGITASQGPVDEDDDVLLVSGIEWGYDDGDDLDDEASKASGKSKWKSPRVGGLSRGKKNIGKKVSSLARGIAHRQTSTKSHDSQGAEEKGRSRRRGSTVASTRSKPKQKPRIIIDKMDELNKLPHGMKSPSAAKGILHLISPRTTSTVGLSAAESKDCEGHVVNVENSLGALDQRSPPATRSPSKEGDMPSIEPIPDDVCNGVADDGPGHGDINPQSSSPRNESSEEPDSDQENVHRGSINLDGDISHRERRGMEEITLQLGIAKQALDLSAAGDSKTMGKLLSTHDVYKKKSLLAKAQAKREKAQENDNDTNSSPSSSSWGGKEILVRPRIIDLTPSMVSSDATTSTLAHRTTLSSQSPLQRNSDAGNEAKSQGSCQKRRQGADASFILDDIAASKRRSPPPTDTKKSEEDLGVEKRPKAPKRPATPKSVETEKSAGSDIGTGTAAQSCTSPHASPEAASAAKSPSGSFHRQVLMEMIMQDIASAAGEYLTSSASTSARSEGPDDDEDSSRKQGSSIFSFEDESVAMASYSSARMVKELKEELLPSIAESNKARRAPSPHPTGAWRKPSALRGSSSSASSASSGTMQTGAAARKKKQVSFREQRDVWYYREQEGGMLARAGQGQASAAYLQREDILFDEHDYDDGDGSVFSAGDYYYYGGEDFRYRGRTVPSCGAGSTACGKEEADHDDFSQAVMDVLLDWRDMMGQHEAVMDAIRHVSSGTRLDCLQEKFKGKFRSGGD